MTMADHKLGTWEEHLQARLRLLAAEKEHTRRGDELAVMRRALPWVRVSKRYVFDTSEGVRTLADLEPLREWVENGAPGLFVIDGRINAQRVSSRFTAAKPK